MSNQSESRRTEHQQLELDPSYVAGEKMAQRERFIAIWNRVKGRARKVALWLIGALAIALGAIYGDADAREAADADALSAPAREHPRAFH